MLICVLFSGCAAQQIEFQALAHKTAITSSADKILLTNILRASRKLAIDYTAITEYKANGIVSGSLAPQLPFGGGASSLFSLDPTLNVGAGINLITIQNFGHQKESSEIIHQESKTDNFLRLVDAGWPSRLVETLLIQKLTIRKEFKNEVFKNSNDVCTKAKEKEKTKLNMKLAEKRSLKKVLGYCKQIDLVDENNCNNDDIKKRENFLNLGNNKCEFLIFQATQSRLDLLNVGYDVFNDLEPYLIDIDPNLRKTYKETEEKLSGDKRRALQFKSRSLDELIRFLGELVEAQLYGDNPWIPEIYLEPDAKELTQLFVVKRGGSIGTQVAISTEFKGEIYSINNADFGNPLGHKSLELFTYVRGRLDQAYAQADLPPSNTLFVQ